jgi:regulator of cell morphogenesis and NO signaling
LKKIPELILVNYFLRQVYYSLSIQGGIMKVKSEDKVGQIATKYPLDDELPRLAAMATKVYEVHGEKDPVKLKELSLTVNSLRLDLEQHMLKEEQILFPIIKRGSSENVDGPVNCMHVEHEGAGVALKKIRELTNNFVVPEQACNTWRALWHGLEALEKDLHLHIHLENNILFPKAVED